MESIVQKRKVVLIGTGLVGMSMAYTLLSQTGIDELVLIDINHEKAVGEAMDLSHGLPYARNKMKITAGEYTDCSDAQIVVVTAGAAQKTGQSRLELTQINTKIIKGITEQIMASGFSGIFVVASNPVDLMTYVVKTVSGMDASKIIGSGTILDTARLRYLMSEYLHISSTNIHAYIMGEHGDSSFVPWTNCYVGCKNLLELLDERHKDLSDLHAIYTQVQQAAYEIIARKKATYYGIGLSLNRLLAAILHDEHSILTISAYLQGEYHQRDLYIGVPAIISKKGIEEIVQLSLTDVDQAKLDASCKTLKDVIVQTIDPLL